MYVSITEEEIKTCGTASSPYSYRVEKTETKSLKINVDANGYGLIPLSPNKNSTKIIIQVCD